MDRRDHGHRDVVAPVTVPNAPVDAADVAADPSALRRLARLSQAIDDGQTLEQWLADERRRGQRRRKEPRTRGRRHASMTPAEANGSARRGADRDPAADWAPTTDRESANPLFRAAPPDDRSPSSGDGPMGRAFARTAPDVRPSEVGRSRSAPPRIRTHRATPTAEPTDSTPPRSPRPTMGYQPALDGLRAVSVIAVILYHAGFSWMRGGFFGVEVFFVVSGFLITSLLIDERERSGSTNLGQFWLRRARRLLPALAAVLAFVGVAAALFGTDEQQSQLRTDFPWAIFYASNWGQIVGGVPYYAGDPPLLRHLWSLAVEEQWYLLWPLAFVALTRLRLTGAARAKLLGSLAACVMFWTFFLHQSGPGPIRSPIDWFDGADRVNFMYLSTFTRSSGLVLGAAAAFVWRPWRSASRLEPAAARRTGRSLDLAGGIAVGALAVIASVAVLTEGYVYQWLLALVSLLSLVAVLVAVHPAAGGFRAVFSWGLLVEIGKRSYGLYLWHWPIFVLMGAPHGSVARVIGAALVTVVLAEFSYRYVETPVRRGVLGRWWRSRPSTASRLAPVTAVGVVVVGLAGYYANVEPFDRAVGGADVTFAEASSVAAPPTSTGAVAPTTSATPAGPSLPRHVVVVGDSQAYSLALNLPDGIEDTFDISDGSLDGCSVYSGGRVRSDRPNFNNDFSICDGWPEKWARSARRADADIALVVLGAWDVFDLVEPDGAELSFGSRAWDDYVSSGLQSGIDALVAEGVHVALLEVPCMRPQDVRGAGVPALPERGDDDRVDHLNDLWRRVAEANPDTVTFVAGPDEWCNDDTIATDLGYRWDGVHVYTPGANLIYETIAPELLNM